MSIPNPGSDAAIKMGCTCPVLDNAHGRDDETGYTDNLTGRAYDRWDAWLARAVQNQE